MDSSNENGKDLSIGPVNPLELLPTEMWHKVLENLECDLNDLLRVSNACPLFQDLLEDKLNRSRLDEVLPLVLQWLPKEDILNCRLVSKRITKGVDGILSNLDTIRRLRHLTLYGKLNMKRIPSDRLKMNHPRGRRHQQRGEIRFNTCGIFMEGQQSVMEEFSLIGTGKMDEYRGRTLSVHHNRLNIGPYRPNLESSLDKLKVPVFKNWTRYLKMTGIYKSSDAVVMYRTFRKILGSLPNLESVTIWISARESPNPLLKWEVQSIAALEDYIEGHPLPEMAVLRYLTLEFMYPAPFLLEVYRQYGGQLKTLEMRNDQEDPVFVSHFSLPVLTHLRIMKPMPLPTFDAPQVTHLELKCSEWTPQEVPFLSHFPKLTSTVLSGKCALKSVYACGGPDSKSFKVPRYPNVKNLQIRDSRSFKSSLKLVVRAFPGLETLSLEVYKLDWRRLSKDQVYKLGIWRITSLKSFKVSDINGIDNGEIKCSFTRDEFKQHFERNRKSV